MSRFGVTHYQDDLFFLFHGIVYLPLRKSAIFYTVEIYVDVEIHPCVSLWTDLKFLHTSKEVKINFRQKAIPEDIWRREWEKQKDREYVNWKKGYWARDWKKSIKLLWLTRLRFPLFIEVGVTWRVSLREKSRGLLKNIKTTLMNTDMILQMSFLITCLDGY